MTNTPEKQPARTQSHREARAARRDLRVQRYLTPTTDRMQRCPKLRAELLSPERLERLREQSRKWREEHGGKVPTRTGVPDGWAGKARRKLRAQVIEQANRKATVIVDKLIENGTVKKDEAGNAVLHWAVSVVLAKDAASEKEAYTTRDRLAAAKMVLDFTMQKPAEKKDVAVTAEAFLAGLLDDDK